MPPEVLRNPIDEIYGYTCKKKTQTLALLLAKYVVIIVAPRAKSVCSFVSLVQTNLGTKSVCSLVTKRSDGFGYTNLDHSRSHKR